MDGFALAAVHAYVPAFQRAIHEALAANKKYGAFCTTAMSIYRVTRKLPPGAPVLLAGVWRKYHVLPVDADAAHSAADLLRLVDLSKVTHQSYLSECALVAQLALDHGSPVATVRPELYRGFPHQVQVLNWR